MHRTVHRICAPALAVIMSMCAAFAGHAAEDDIILNEIMYHPVQDLDELQYLELFNRGEAAVNISKWSFTKGIKFVFPENTTLSGGGYLVVARNRAAFVEQYGANVPVVGDYAGKLSHRGEKIELSNAAGKVIDAVKFSDEEPWPMAPDGYSPSLERISPAVPGKDADNWASSQLPGLEGPGGTPGRRNDSFSANLPPTIARVVFKAPAPGQKAPVTAEVSDAEGVRSVTLLYRLAKSGGETSETAVAMARVAGDEKKGSYLAALEAQPESALVRFRIRAVDAAGTSRTLPAPNEPRPTFSYSTFVNTNRSNVPFVHAISVSKAQAESRGASRGAFLGFLLAPPPGPPALRTPFKGRLASLPAAPTRGNGAFVYLSPGSSEVLTFDHVHVRPRTGGFKVHFLKDQPLRGMTGINVIIDGPPRWVLAEHLAYELHRLAGVPAPASEHVRVWEDGRLSGYQLLIEQPNKSFVARHAGNDTGQLYKITWQGSGIVGQHEKKTNLLSGHADLVETIENLNNKTGADQWEYIQKNFDVVEFVNFYAVRMCMEDWDGFFNNYFIYHDTAGTGKWTIYPWDEDKTWGDYDGASPQYDWYEMPLTFGMKGDRPPAYDRASKANNLPGYFGGVSWWRPAGWFSGPLLANPEFRQRFLARLDEVCATLFTEEKLLPLIDALEKRLEPEVAVRAQANGENPAQALKLFHDHVQSFRNQVKYRRKFLLDELAKTKQPAAVRAASGGTSATAARAGK